MRIDKYLKVSRIIKRRTVANEACSSGRVMINGKTAKPSAAVSEGDRLTIRFGEHIGHYEIFSVRDNVTKDQSSGMYRILEEDDYMSSERGKE